MSAARRLTARSDAAAGGAGGVRKPRQLRSQASMDRVLAATEELLADRLFEELTLAEILARAKVSVGAFYARFGSREGIVQPLHDRYDERLDVVTAQAFDPERWRGVPLVRRVRLLVRYGLAAYHRNRGLLRALVLEWRLHPERITERQRAHRESFYERISTVLIGDGSEITHPDPRAAARFVFLTYGAVCRELLLEGRSTVPLPSAFGGDDRALAAELTRTIHAHLTGVAPPVVD